VNPKREFEKALALHQLGDLANAEKRYRAILRVAPRNFDVNYLLGLIFLQSDQFEHAEKQFSRAVKINPNAFNAFNDRGNALLELNRPGEALVNYDKAIALDDNFTDAFNNRGNALVKLGRLDEALASYEKAITLKPDFAKAFYNRGNVLRTLKQISNAISSYGKAIELKPDYAEAFNNRGNTFLELRHFDEAIADYVKAIGLNPFLIEAYCNQVSALLDLNRLEEAFAVSDKALALGPNFAQAWITRGDVLRNLRRYEEALTSYDKAIALKPDITDAWLGRGIVFYETNLNNKAISDFQRAVEINPNSIEARFAACVAELPILYTNEDEIVQRREAYERKLLAICADVEAGRVQGDLVKAIEFRQPFQLAYQGLNDCYLQTLYGSLVCRIIEREYPTPSLPQPPAAEEPVKVGIVSTFFHQHPVWNLLIKGWISQLDRKRFRIFGYHIGTYQDAETDIAAAICDRFVRVLTVKDCRREILADAPHVLIYPGQLMENISIQLAAQRLAPVQCNSWGHPTTSGMPTLDYFLSSDLMEPSAAEQHYSERLVRLPNLSTYYEPIKTDTITMTREELGLRSDATVFWSGQSLFKYLPQFDHVFPRIANEALNCQFVFIKHFSPKITELFQERLNRAFAAFGREASNHCVLLPRLKIGQFVGAIGQCDVFLDSILWSGGNSTLESLPHNIPIVTMLGPFMRGRHSAAILQMMGIEETIAGTIDDYISIAGRLANHPDERHAIGQKIAERKQRIYRDRECILALERFLDHAARQRAD
jgi:predicted O-linked N-acetylglucosamine transferase (SPINDLY family)